MASQVPRCPEWLARNAKGGLAATQVTFHPSEGVVRSHLERGDVSLLYPAVKRGTGYVALVVTMVFGGRATGEPHSTMTLTCDIEGQVAGVSLPVAAPMVMSVKRTFWETATAAHVCCAQGRIRGSLQVVPDGAAREALAADYASTLEDQVAVGDMLHFEDLMAACDEVASRANTAAGP